MKSRRSAPLETLEEVREANQQLVLAALREHELAARANEAARQMTALLQTMSEGATVFDGDGAIVLVNETGRRLLGCFGTNSPVIADYQQCNLMTLDGRPIDFAAHFLARLLRGESFFDEEAILLTASGQRHLVFSGTVVREKDEPVQLAINVYRDVTELRHLEQARERYVALVTHDLRGPLSAAQLSAQFLEKHGAAEHKPLAVRIVKNLVRMGAMIRDLLDTQQIRAGHSIPLKIAPCDLAAIAREVVEDLGALDANAVFLLGESSLTGSWSADHLQRAIWNLLRNALAYGTPGQPIALTVAADGAMATLSVHNFGRTIPPAVQAAIFQPYARAALEGEAHGWGLGLAFVQGCAESHGGSISVESSDATGTTFTLRLPLSR